METTLKYDRCILVKELNDKFYKIGEVFEVANVLENSFLLRDAKSGIAVGVVTFEDFEKHFVLEENFTGWTSWQYFTGFDGHTDCFYKTNRRDVEVKFLTDKVRAKSFMHKDDDFNLSFGLNLAYLRCINKALEKKKSRCEEEFEEKKNKFEEEKNKFEEELKQIDSEIADNKRSIQKMINNLNS